MKILFLGDIYGRPGRTAVMQHLPALMAQYAPDFVIANGENATQGSGLIPKHARELLAAGIDAFTMGNHTFRKAEVTPFLNEEKHIVRPANYADDKAGKGFLVLHKNGQRLGIINLMGRTFMHEAKELNCPFEAWDNHAKRHTLGEHYDALLVDVHAEATSEKKALGYLIDGHASVVVGTHTHIPTADVHIMPHGTAYQSDSGMCGVRESVLGVTTTIATENFRRAPFRKEVANGHAEINGLFIETKENGLAQKVERVYVPASNSISA